MRVELGYSIYLFLEYANTKTFLRKWGFFKNFYIEIKAISVNTFPECYERYSQSSKKSIKIAVF